MRELKRSFESIEEAVGTLVESTKEHCERVAAYTEIIFLEARAEEIYSNDPKAQSRLKEEMCEVAKEAALYHDLGKAMFPEEYQTQSKNFSDEEYALFQSHVTNSVNILTEHYRRELGRSALQERYLLEAIAQHHENWNGTGYPAGLKGTGISILARIISLAEHLDHWFCRVHSEHPFEDAMVRAREEAGNRVDPELVELLPNIEKKLKKVFMAHVTQTRTIPAIDGFVRKGPQAPIAIWYRPIEDRAKGETVACEGIVKFRFAGHYVDYEEVEHLITEDVKTRRDLGAYIALSMCDTVRRIDAGQLPIRFVAVRLPGGMITIKGLARDFISAAADSKVSPERLCLVLGKDNMTEFRSVLRENIRLLQEAGCKIILDGLDVSFERGGSKKPQRKSAKPVEEEEKTEAVEGAEESDEIVIPEKPKKPANDRYIPGVVTPAEILSMGVKMYRLSASDAPHLVEASEFYDNMFKLASEKGVKLLSDNIEEDKMQSFLEYLDVELATGPLRGTYTTEDDFYRLCLIEEKMKEDFGSVDVPKKRAHQKATNAILEAEKAAQEEAEAKKKAEAEKAEAEKLAEGEPADEVGQEPAEAGQENDEEAAEENADDTAEA